MTETTQISKQFKLSPERRSYFANKAREKRILGKKCKVCGHQARWKDLLTQEMYCSIHTVAPLRGELIKQQGEQKNVEKQN